ncbi:MAG: PKD domain-containing protein, partial [Anaerolineae bacterium]
PGHAYEVPGTYTVTLTVAGPGGSKTETKADYVTAVQGVQGVSHAGLHYTPAGDLFTGNVVLFVAQARGTVPLTYTWSVDGMPTGENQSWLEHRFDAAGTYSVAVTLTNAAGQQDAHATVVIEEGDLRAQPDLSSSRQLVSPASVQSGDLMTYTLILGNSSDVRATATLTDPIPAHTTYVPGSAVASDGATPTVMDGAIHWSGQIVSGVPVIIEYVVEFDAPAAMQEGCEIANVAHLTDQLGHTVRLVATATYNPQARVTIDNGAQFTNVPTVTLSLSDLASSPHMQISNSAGFGTGTGWIDAGTTYHWVLNTQGHPHTPSTVYAMFRSKVGEQHGPVHDDIIFDPVPPSVSQAVILDTVGSGPVSAGSENAVLWTTVSDDNSGVNRVQVSDDPGFHSYQEYAVTGHVLAIPIHWEPHTFDAVFVRAVDRAGNLSEVRRGAGHVMYLPLCFSGPL